MQSQGGVIRNNPRGNKRNSDIECFWNIACYDSDHNLIISPLVSNSFLVYICIELSSIIIFLADEEFEEEPNVEADTTDAGSTASEAESGLPSFVPRVHPLRRTWETIFLCRG